MLAAGRTLGGHNDVSTTAFDACFCNCRQAMVLSFFAWLAAFRGICELFLVKKLLFAGCPDKRQPAIYTGKRDVLPLHRPVIRRVVGFNFLYKIIAARHDDFSIDTSANSRSVVDFTVEVHRKIVSYQGRL